MRSDAMYVSSAMLRYGGSFVKALGLCIERASSENVDRIHAAFPEYWAKYNDLAHRGDGVLDSEVGDTTGEE